MKKKTYLIGNAHLDPVWQWRVPEGLALVKSTYQSALDRMEEFPEYVFTSACAGYYHWIKLSEPELFERICQRVREGRWRYVGGMWVQPDCNLPCGESFARHLLYSQRFFTENFGAPTHTGYNVDSFGHNGMLPQLLQKAGIENYVYMRPNDTREKPQLGPHNLHFWQSPDGSRVLAYRIPDCFGGYTGAVTRERLELLQALEPTQMLFYGIGNHGGGPAVEHLKAAEALRREDDSLVYAGPQDYFEAVRANGEAETAPTVTQDLQHHASGCYSANSKIKQLNRQAEAQLICAEKAAVLSHLLTGASPCREAITAAWQRVMFNQFHDILAGCSIKPAYADAYHAFGAALQTALETETYAAERISWRINTTRYFENRPSEMRDRLWAHEGEGSPMVVFNPHSFPVKTQVAFGMGFVSGVVDSQDRDVPFQLVRAPYTDGGHYQQCLFEAELPAYGWGTYFIFHRDQSHESPAAENEFALTEHSLENSRVRLTFDKVTGGLASFVDKETGREVSGGILGRTVLCEDIENDTWAHHVYNLNRDVDEFVCTDIQIAETGPLRACVKTTSVCRQSVLTQYFTLHRGSNQVEVRCKLNFNEKYKLAKLCFTANAETPSVVYSMPFGFLEKQPDGAEEPCHKWAVLKGSDGSGLAVLNDGKYSFCAQGRELRFAAARGCAYLDHFGAPSRDGEMEFLDQGLQEFTYALRPFDGELVPVVRAAELLNLPCKLYNETHHTGTLPPVYGGISVSADNILVETIKTAENGTGLVLRALECAGVPTRATLKLTAANAAFTGDWAPQEFKTLLVPTDGSPIREMLLTEEP